MYEGDGGKKIHMLEYITFSEGKQNSDICRHIQPSSGKLWRTWMSNRESRKWFKQNFLSRPWRLDSTTDQNSRTFSVLTSGPGLCNRANKHYLILNNSSHERVEKQGEAEQNEWIEVIESYRQRERGKFCLLSTVLITMALRNCVLWNHML